jgi:type IV secretion system protein VirB10
MTTCLVTRPIRSDSGRVVLIDRGSLVTGEYRSSAVLGEDRLMVLWRRLKNPDGVVINLESPATDPLGTAGVSGELDAHWRDRIGAAFLLSVIQDGIAYAANSRQSDAGTTTVVLPNTTQTGGQMANKVLESTIGIAPTLTKMQGERVAILVARDLRFESQYRDTPDYLGR